MILFGSPVLLPSLGLADCLTGPGSTGYQSGSWTLSLLLPNAAAMSEIEGETCGPNSGQIGPLQAAAGWGQSQYVTNYGGASAGASILAGGTQAGSGSAGSGGLARWTVRVDSQPGYVGPSSVDIDIQGLVVVTGQTQVSGQGSAGGTYQSEFSIKLANGALATILFGSNGGLSPGFSASPLATTSVQIDTDYLIQLHQVVQVSAVSTVNPMNGSISAASSSGSLGQSFGVQVNPAFADPMLEVKFPIEDVPGGFAPFPGSAPFLPTLVPVATWPGMLALAAALSASVFALGRSRA